MSITQYKRLLALLSVLLVFSLGVFFILTALQSNINLFFTPSEIKQQHIEISKLQEIRLGGLVKPGSVNKHDLKVDFIVTDYKAEKIVSYTGLLPDLFKEGQSVVVQGIWDGYNFKANSILAKHDENYMPKELVSLKKNRG